MVFEKTIALDQLQTEITNLQHKLSQVGNKDLEEQVQQQQQTIRELNLVIAELKASGATPTTTNTSGGLFGSTGSGLNMGGRSFFGMRGGQQTTSTHNSFDEFGNEPELLDIDSVLQSIDNDTDLVFVSREKIPTTTTPFTSPPATPSKLPSTSLTLTPTPTPTSTPQKQPPGSTQPTPAPTPTKTTQQAQQPQKTGWASSISTSVWYYLGYKN